KVGEGRFRAAFAGRGAGGDGFVEPAQQARGLAEVAPGQGQAGVDFEGLAVVADGLEPVGAVAAGEAAVAVDVAAVVVGGGVLGVGVDGLGVVAPRLAVGPPSLLTPSP